MIRAGWRIVPKGPDAVRQVPPATTGMPARGHVARGGCLGLKPASADQVTWLRLRPRRGSLVAPALRGTPRLLCGRYTRSGLSPAGWRPLRSRALWCGRHASQVEAVTAAEACTKARSPNDTPWLWAKRNCAVAVQRRENTSLNGVACLREGAG